ncbi:MAG: tetratricopeptide repeat protein [Phycisphaerae bacterium]|nr:tetratricopeptide repeat protein [Phycisphaerae bacterium]
MSDEFDANLPPDDESPSDDASFGADPSGFDGSTNERAAERHAELAAEHFRRGRMADAEAELRRALANNPSRGDWHFNLGLMLDASGRFDEALRSFREATLRLPRRIEVRLAEATTLGRLGRYGDALATLEAACVLDPSSDLAWAKRIEALAELGRFDDAETIYYIAQERLESMPISLVSMGDVQLSRGAHERAAWCYREALAAEPQLPKVRARLGRALAAGGNAEPAVRLFIEELRSNPGDIETLIECGDCLATLHRPTDAMEKYRRAAELAPALALPRVRLGLLLGAFGRHEQARAELETAYGLDPDVGLCRTSLAATALTVALTPAERANAIVLARRLLAEDIERRRDFSSEAAAAEFLRLADVLIREELPGLACDVLARVSAERPYDAAILRKRMVAAFAGGRGRTARGLARRLMRVDPSAGPAVAHNLVLDALERGRPMLALSRLRSSIERYPQDPGLRSLRVTSLVSAAIAALRRGRDRLFGRAKRPHG